MSWFEWFFIFSLFSLFFGFALISASLFMRFEKKRTLSGVSFFFLMCMAISTAYFGAQYAETKIQINVLEESIKKFEKHLQERLHIPSPKSPDIKNVGKIS